MKTPDITPAQIVSLITMVVSQLIANAAIDNDTGKLITSIAGIVIPAAWMVGDAIIRRGRAQAHAAIEAAKVHALPGTVESSMASLKERIPGS